jgi:hypothetical protein
MTGLKLSQCASTVLAAVDLMCMFRKGQFSTDSVLSFDNKFHLLMLNKPEHLFTSWPPD